MGAGIAAFAVRHDFAKPSRAVDCTGNHDFPPLFWKRAPSVFGLCTKPPPPGVGRMLGTARQYISEQYLDGDFPGLAVFIPP